MRIVFANKYYFPHRGAERYVFDLERLLRGHGHEVAPFAMRTERDAPTPWRKYFVSQVQTEKTAYDWQGLRTAARYLYSFEARRKFSALLDEFRPDLIHVHNIYHQISPSILPVAKRRGLPVVLTAHDYALLAPNYALFHDGNICEVTKPDRFWRAVKHRCVKGSLMASALCAAEMTLHRKLGLWDNLDRIIVPSRFMQALFADYGWPAEKIVHVPHFADLSVTPAVGAGDYALFAGALSAEKGVATLVRAAAQSRHVPVRIVGTGPEETALKKLAAELGASNIEFRGFKSGAALAAEYAGARFVVMPSIWYEVFGLTALEAYAAGKPVVASEIGGLAELVRPGETGVPVSAGDAGGLAEVMDGLWHDADWCKRMGLAGRAWAETEFTPERHYEQVMAVYRAAGAKGI
ncbi:MAG: glycosyltransferase [Patescibacteria group bacterium]|nr:glycosyltransferase [Patescibacteria group bacterium]